MKIYFENVGYFARRGIQKIFEKAIEKTNGYICDVAIGVKFVSEDEIRLLNKNFRHIDKVKHELSLILLEVI